MTTPSAERWRRIQEIFDAVVDLEPAARTLYIAAACVNDPALRVDVERLLAADVEAGSREFLDDIVRDAALDLAHDITRTGHRVGNYRIVKELGRGGMGAVYLAERADHAYAGRVAIKFVRGAAGDTDLRRRFRSERQILADLRHPGIPRLLDGGEAEDGTPFLVMEYIEGEPITQHVRRLGLPIRARLRLFLAVCDAVAHAHRSLIVHRDIKPGNVLVDREGTPRLVDFGIAKPLGPDFTAETTTVFRRLTPAHASPEQLRGERITVATDVYALGLLLYELVSGVQPFAIRDASSAEIQRRVLEEEVRPPSTAAATEPDPARPSLPRALAGDIDAIALTALRKEPERRYASVEQLAQDVHRALDGRPVLARAGQPGYRVARFVSRYRGPIVAAAAVLLIAGILGAVSIVRLLDSRAAERADRLAAERVNQVLVELLETGANADPASVRAALDRASAELAAGSAAPSPERARLLLAIGGAYAGIGADARAESVLDDALRVAERVDGPDHPRVAAALEAIARLRLRQGRLDDARAAADRAVRILEGAGDGPEAGLSLAGALAIRGEVRTASADFAGAVGDIERAIQLRSTGAGADDAALAPLYDALAAARRGTGDGAGADEAAARARRLRGEPATAGG